MTLEKNIRVNRLLDIYGGLLTSKQYDILLRYYANDCSLAEIGEILNISRQAVNDALKQGIEILEKYESKMKLLEKINNIIILGESLNAKDKKTIEKVIDILEE